MNTALVIVFLGLSCQAEDPVERTSVTEVLELFPLKAGNQWSYWHQRKVAVGHSEHFITITWEQEITIKAIHALPQGRFVERHSKVAEVSWDAPPQVPQPMAEAIAGLVTDHNLDHLLILDHSVTKVPNWAFDAEAGSIRPFFQIAEANHRGLASLLLDSRNTGSKNSSRELRELALVCEGLLPKNIPFWNLKGVMDLDGPHQSWQDVWVLEGSNQQDNPSVWFKPGVGVVGSSFVSKSGRFENYSLLAEFSGVEPIEAPKASGRISLK